MLRLPIADRHGANYIQFYERVKNEDPTYVLVETMAGEVFGGYASVPWKASKDVSVHTFVVAQASLHKARVLLYIRWPVPSCPACGCCAKCGPHWVTPVLSPAFYWNHT